MRKLNAWMFVTLDGVVEAPEGWVMPDPEMFAAIEADYASADALLLGRKTYEIFAASWPQRSNEVPNAEWMNTSPKYVASSTLTDPEWENSQVLEGDLIPAVTGLKEAAGKTILVNGSAKLVRSLLRDGLLDELRLYVLPKVVGSGARMFPESEEQLTLELADSTVWDSGIVSLVYTPSG